MTIRDLRDAPYQPPPSNPNAHRIDALPMPRLDWRDLLARYEAELERDKTRPRLEVDVPRSPHPEGLRAARLVLNEGLSVAAAAKECDIGVHAVKNAIWRYYEEHPDRREVLDAAEFDRRVGDIGFDTGATVEQIVEATDLYPAGSVVVTLKGGKQDRYASLAHYASSRAARTNGALKGSQMLARLARDAKDSQGGSVDADPEPDAAGDAAPGADSPVSAPAPFYVTSASAAVYIPPRDIRTTERLRFLDLLRDLAPAVYAQDTDAGHRVLTLYADQVKHLPNGEAA